MKNVVLRVAVVMSLLVACVRADDRSDSVARTKQAMDRALAFLVSIQQPDGSWTHRDKGDPAITALAAEAFIQSPDFGPAHPVSRRAIEFIIKFVQPDGGIYVPDEGQANYQTSVALMALVAARDPAHAEVIAKAQAYLKKGQWDEEESIDPKNEWYGGAGYGKSKRPDLSNTQMMLEALHQSGLPKDDPVYKKAIVFISRSQMFGETNDRPFAKGASDGGFIYTCVGDGESKGGDIEVDGQKRLRTYGSMSYSGFKSLLYAGLAKDDPRVKAAYEWIRRYYTLDENPNMPAKQSHEGLYYYYLVFSRALNAWGDPTLIDAAGKPHQWRDELRAKLVTLQRADGSWVNDADRWYESNPGLVTAYAILAIQSSAG